MGEHANSHYNLHSHFSAQEWEQKQRVHIALLELKFVVICDNEHSNTAQHGFKVVLAVKHIRTSGTATSHDHIPSVKALAYSGSYHLSWCKNAFVVPEV